MTNPELRLAVAKTLLQIAEEHNGPVTDKLKAAARDHRVSVDYAAETFWELVRLGFLDSHGRLKK